MRKNLKVIIAFYAIISQVKANCSTFLKNYKEAKSIVFLENNQNLLRESKPTLSRLNTTLSPEMEADVFAVSAMLTAYRDNTNLSLFYENSNCINRSETTLTKYTKYRSIDGYGNNLKHPHWGKAYTPFGRFGPKNYFDNIIGLRKSEKTRQDLPNPRIIVDSVLKKAPRVFRKSNFPNIIFLALFGFLTLDIGISAQKGSMNGRQLSCCSEGAKSILPESIRHSACIPWSVPKNDPFYNDFGVQCMNQARSFLISSPTNLDFDIRNIASSFVDLSPIYGQTLNESIEIRNFRRGQIRLTRGQVYPANAKGKLPEAAFRLSLTPQQIFIPLFLRNHNKIAERLASLNPSWDDKKLFQESRRINIAILQNYFISKDYTNILFGSPLSKVQNYDEKTNPSTTVEFLQAATRVGHSMVQTKVILEYVNKSITEIPVSDTIFNTEIPEKNFDNILRGTLNQRINIVDYTDELHNKLFKKKNPFGLDLFGIDIQRGRDHGLPTWLQMRKTCGLTAFFNSFRDLIQIFPLQTVKLLEKTYSSVADIDLIVGGILESFNFYDRQLLGPTLGCIYREQHRRMTSGDAYFFTHSTNPTPFTPSQLTEIKKFTINHLICVNSNVEFTLKNPLHIESSQNPKVRCSNFKFMDLRSWKN